MDDSNKVYKRKRVRRLSCAGCLIGLLIFGCIAIVPLLKTVLGLGFMSILGIQESTEYETVIMDFISYISSAEQAVIISEPETEHYDYYVEINNGSIYGIREPELEDFQWMLENATSDYKFVYQDVLLFQDDFIIKFSNGVQVHVWIDKLGDKVYKLTRIDIDNKPSNDE